MQNVQFDDRKDLYGRGAQMNTAAPSGLAKFVMKFGVPQSQVNTVLLLVAIVAIVAAVIVFSSRGGTPNTTNQPDPDSIQ